jgi:hypothetical protein
LPIISHFLFCRCHRTRHPPNFAFKSAFWEP